MATGFVGQIFNSIQGEGLYAGRRQVFVRFAGCSLDCVYCDTDGFRQFKLPKCEIETSPSSGKLNTELNPMTHAAVIGHLRRLVTPDIHSVSLTGGEPLQAGDFLLDIARDCKREGLATYLETNGSNSNAMRKIVQYTDFAAIDIKLPEHHAVPAHTWPSLLREELSCVKLSLENEVDTFVKVVVLPRTSEKIVAGVCKKLVKIGKVPLVLQPVYPARMIKRFPSMTHVYHIAQSAAKAGINEIAIIPQINKLIGVF